MIRHPTIPIFAQAEEDIIIHRLLQSFGMSTDTGTFLEIGVGDGTRNNTRSLASRGWHGTWIGNELLSFKPDSVYFEYAQVELSNLHTLPLTTPVDLVSIDIDGNDYWIAEQIVPRLMPRILVVEYNAAWEEPDAIMPYAPGYRWTPGMPFGASLSAWVHLLLPLGYALECVTQAQVNAFFVRR